MVRTPHTFLGLAAPLIMCHVSSVFIYFLCLEYRDGWYTTIQEVWKSFQPSSMYRTFLNNRFVTFVWIACVDFFTMNYREPCMYSCISRSDVLTGDILHTFINVARWFNVAQRWFNVDSTLIQRCSLVQRCSTLIQRWSNVDSTLLVALIMSLRRVFPELSTGRMDPRVGSGRVGSRFCRISAGRVGSGRVSTLDF